MNYEFNDFAEQYSYNIHRKTNHEDEVNKYEFERGIPLSEQNPGSYG